MSEEIRTLRRNLSQQDIPQKTRVSSLIKKISNNFNTKNVIGGSLALALTAGLINYISSQPSPTEKAKYYTYQVNPDTSQRYQKVFGKNGLADKDDNGYVDSSERMETYKLLRELTKDELENYPLNDGFTENELQHLIEYYEGLN